MAYTYSKIIDFLLPFTGGFSSLRARLSPGIRILMYHRIIQSEKYDQLSVSPELFSEQMKFLSENYRVISIKEAIDKLEKGKYSGNEVVITFDDGYMDNYTEALAILEEYKFSASIYITTSFTDGIQAHPRYPDESAGLHMNWDILDKISRRNIILGAHTQTHPYLQQISPQHSHKEIFHSKKLIEEKLNIPVDVFCYPSGDFGKREINYVKDAGYRAALTVSPGVNRSTTNLFKLKRTEITNKDSIPYFSRKLAGAFDPLHKLLDLKRKYLFYKSRYISG